MTPAPLVYMITLGKVCLEGTRTLCTLTSSHIVPTRSAYFCNVFVYNYEFPTFKEDKVKALANTFQYVVLPPSATPSLILEPAWRELARAKVSIILLIIHFFNLIIYSGRQNRLAERCCCVVQCYAFVPFLSYRTNPCLRSTDIKAWLISSLSSFR